jgi:hypothetical protein
MVTRLSISYRTTGDYLKGKMGCNNACRRLFIRGLERIMGEISVKCEMADGFKLVAEKRKAEPIAGLPYCFGKKLFFHFPANAHKAD